MPESAGCCGWSWKALSTSADLGGIATEDGGSTARGQLLRADNLQDLSPADITYLLHSVRLSTVIDLRTRSDIHAEGPAPLTKISDVSHVHHSLLSEEAGNATEALLAWNRYAARRHSGDSACAHYLGYVEDRPGSIVGALRAINRASGAALVHCAAGKDRTGVVIAFALTVAGVLREEIVRDYAATGERIAAILDRLRATTTYAGNIDRVPMDQQIPRTETMAEFLEQIDTRYGGVHRWLDQNGFTADEVQALRCKLRT